MGNDKIILFDFDGVIVNSFKTAFGVNKMLRTKTDFSEDDYRKCFEGNIFDKQPKNNEKIDDEEFFKLYIPKLLQLPVIDGIREALIELSGQYKLIIISSSTSNVIHDWLTKHNLVQYFVDILGADVHKSKIEKIKMVFEKYGTGVADCVFITDTLGDLREANKLNVQSLAVTYGVHNEATLSNGNPIALIRRPQDIVAEVEKYWNKI
ncbi:MAG: HAD-IA family hydrolase [Candidatus Gribaldobacteria bacterium]|nr:HAD-IA family hydrolase [Candidatus Gribaldobacteria bacterium]